MVLGLGEEIEGVVGDRKNLLVHSVVGGCENSLKRVPMELWEMGRT